MEAAAAKLLQDQGVTPELLLVRTMPGVTEDSLAGLIAEVADEGESAVLDYRADLRRIDAEVMPNARPEEKQKATNAAHERINAFEPALERLQGEINKGEALTIAPQVRQRMPTNVDREDWLRAESEARIYIRGLGDIERKSTYLAACAAGDCQTARAYELAPAIAPLVDAETILEGAELFAAVSTPERHGLLEQQRTTMRAIQCEINRATRELGAVATPVEELVTEGVA